MDNNKENQQMDAIDADTSKVKRSGKHKFTKKGSFAKYRNTSEGARPNDPAWYAQSQQLLRDAASLSFATPQGVRTHATGMELGSYPIHVLSLTTTIGKANSASDPATVAARQIYSFVRHANSGSANYEAPDLFMYLLAIGELYAVHGWLTRVYGTLRFFNGMNRSVPKNLLAAMGVEYDDIMLHISDLRLFINLVARKLNSFYVPANLPYFKRKFFIYSQVFTDTPDPKADIFMFNPYWIMKFDGTSDPNGSKLTKLRWFDAGYNASYTTIVTRVNELFDALLGEEDINIMSGDILKAYGKNVIQLSEIPEEYVVTPTFSGEMLAQYHNASIITKDSYPSEDVFDIYQDSTGAIHQDCKVQLGAASTAAGKSNFALARAQILDADTDTSPEYVMSATRLKVGGTVVYTGGTGVEVFTITSCGTEVAISSFIMYYAPNSTDDVDVANAYFGLKEGTTSFTTFIANTSEYLSRMHWHPLIYVVTNSGLTVTKVIGELNNFTTLEISTMEKMHNVALMSLLGISAGPSILAANSAR